MVSELSINPRVVGPFFIKAVSMDEMWLDSEDGINKVRTISVTIDAQDANNQEFQIGVGISHELFVNALRQLSIDSLAD